MITPWLIDVLDAPLQQLLQQIRHALRPQGFWLNHGSVAFRGSAANRLDTSEVRSITEQAGFDSLVTSEDHLPYLQSPHSRQHRVELVYTQLARKTSQPAPDSPTASYWPDWLTDSSKVVPFTPAFRAQLTNTRIHGFIMGLIDGERSINDMAVIMEEQRLMPKAQARQALRGFIQKMVEEARSRDGSDQD